MASTHPRTYDFSPTLEGVCERVAVMLNDADPHCENARWSKPYIRSLVRDGLHVMARIASEHFVKQEKWTLQAGECVATLPDGCMKLLQVLCITDLKTGKSVNVSSVDTDAIARHELYPSRCTGSDVSGFSIDTSGTTATGFSVSPTPTEDDRYEVTANCVSLNDWVVGGNICEDFPTSVHYLIPALVQLVTALALAMSRDDPTAGAQAQTHLAIFSALLQLDQSHQITQLLEARSV